MEFYSEYIKRSKNRKGVPLINFVSSEGVVTYDEVSFIVKLEKIRRALFSILDTNDNIIAISPVNHEVDIFILLALSGLDIDIILLSPSLPHEKTKQILGEAGVDTFISKEVFNSYVKVKVIDFTSIMELSEKVNTEFPLEYAGARLIFLTSGSTSSSKMVYQQPSQLISNAIAISSRLNLDEKSRFVGVLPVYHVNGFHLSLMANLLSGTALTIVSDFDPFLFPDILFGIDPHLVSVVPTILNSIYPILCRTGTNPSLEAFISAAAPLSKYTALNYLTKLSTKILQGYGLSETTNMSTMISRNISMLTYKNIMFSTDTPSIGSPLSCNDIIIVDELGRVCNEGEVGELFISGDNVFDKYLNYDCSDEFVYINSSRYFKTGDLGFYIKEDLDSFYFLVGRKKNIAKINGVCISIEEMEHFVREVVNNCDLAIFVSINSITKQESLLLLVDQEINFDNVLSNLATYYDKKILPNDYIVVNKIPRSNTGKILRPLLKDLV